MGGQSLVERVREERATELGRVGSDKYLVAATGADLSIGPVLRAMAQSAATGREVFGDWADEADADGTDAGESDGDGTAEAAAAFARAAETERDHYDRIAAELRDRADDDERPAPEDGPVREALEEAAETPERIGAGLIGRSLVADRTHLQAVNFFVNEGDRDRADLFRDLRSDHADRVDDAAALLERACESDEDWDRAAAAAERVVEAAYREYADALESMGLDPKPVC